MQGVMRDEKYEQELKVQKANQRIFELQRTNGRWGGCLKDTARSVGRITENRQKQIKRKVKSE